MARRKVHEEHANHEAWAIPYGDLVTLLLAFFVVMYSISSVNEGKFRTASDSLNAAFGGAPRSVTPVQLGQTHQQGSLYDQPSPIQSVAKNGPAAMAKVSAEVRLRSDPRAAGGGDANGAQRSLDDLGVRVQGALAALVEKKLVTIRRGAFWIEVEISSDILFASGSAQTEPEGRVALYELAQVLRDVPNLIRVEGYTDNRPIATPAFPSNWELSAARAATVVHVFAASAIPAERMAVVGYGDVRARASNDDAAGRRANRRVVLVILAQPEGAAVPGRDPALASGREAESTRGDIAPPPTPSPTAGRI